MRAALEVTLLIGVLLAVAWRWRPARPVERGARALLLAYGLLGACALWFAWYAPGQEPARLVSLKPTVIYWTLAAILIMAPLFRGGYPIKAIFGTFFLLSGRQWGWMNLGFGATFAVLGTVNLLVASHKGNWESFKYGCMMIPIFLILFRINFVWLDIITRAGVHLYRRARSLFP